MVAVARAMAYGLISAARFRGDSSPFNFGPEQVAQLTTKVYVPGRLGSHPPAARLRSIRITPPFGTGLGPNPWPSQIDQFGSRSSGGTECPAASLSRFGLPWTGP